MANVPRVDVATLQKIAPGDLRLLWVNDWLDGSLEAVVEHDGKPCLMILAGEDASAESPYRWLLVHLSPEQRAEEETWHALFAEHVGTHWCFHGDEIAHAPPADDADPEKFFVPYRNRPALDVSVSAIVGWADEMPTR